MYTQLILIDPTVPQPELLLTALQPDTKAILLDNETDAIDQISRHLRGYQGLEALHIVTHGSPGQLHFSNTVLSNETLNQYWDQLAGWSAAMAENADILLYGCETGLGESGRLMINQLADITGCNIAAATSTVGHNSLGASWALAATTTVVSSSIFASPEAVENWQHRLADTLITNDGAGSGDTSNASLGQSFIATIDGSLTAIKVAAAVVNGNETLKIYSGAGTDSNNLLYTQANVSFTDTVNSNNDYTFTTVTLTTPVAITSNSTYTFEFSGGNVSLEYISNAYDDGAIYLGGNPNSSFDLAFEIVQSPSNANPSLTVDDLSYTEGNTTQVDTSATADDTDGNTDWDTNAKLEVQITANNEAGDQISIGDIGNIAVVGSAVKYSGTTIGNIAETSGTSNDGTVTNGDKLTINLVSAATSAAVQELARAIQYSSSSDTPTATNSTRTITYTLTDKNGGSKTDTSTVTITAVNDDPTVATNTGSSLNEGAVDTISNTELNEGDPDDSGTGLTYTATTDAANGQLFLDADGDGVVDAGEEVDLNDTFTQDDIDNSRLKYKHDGSETTSDSFVFSLADGGENGAATLTGQTFNLTISAQNDAPTVAVNNASSLNEGAVDTLSNTELNAYDPDDSGAGLTYTVTTDATNGQLFLDADGDGVVDSGEEVDLNDTFTQGDIDNSRLKYKHDGSETTSDSFVFSLADGGENGAATLTGQTFNLTITGVNDEPTLTATGDDSTYIEGGDGVSVFSSTAIDAIESGQNIAGLTFTVTNISGTGSTELITLDGTEFALADSNSGTTAGGNTFAYSVSLSSGTATVTVTKADSAANYQTLLDGLSYRNSSTGLDGNDRVFTITTLQDAGGTANSGDDTAALNVASTIGTQAAPTITDASYDYSTNTLVVTGTDFVANSGANDDVDISKLTLTGEGGASHQLTAATDVEIESATQFTVNLSGADLTAVEALLNKDGTQAADGSTDFNLAAADNWMPGAPATADIADATGNGITVSNYAGPQITGSTYNFATGVLVLTGSNFVANSGGDDVDVTQLTLTGEGGSTYTLTSATSNVNITSDTEITVTLGATDKLNVNGLLNKDLTSSDGGTTYNLAAAEDWLTGAAASLTVADATTGITVSNYAAPTVSDATYDADSGVLAVTGTNFVKAPGADNDIDFSTITLTGQGGSSHNLASTSGVEITSATGFSVTLTGSDKTGVDALLDQIGTSSSSGTTYNIAAADNWLTGAPASANIEDQTLNGITVQVAPKITSASYDASAGTLTVTGSNIQEKTGSDNDIDASTLTFTGEGGDTYTLVGTADVDRTSATAFTLTLDATDKSAVNQLLNKSGGTSTGGTTFNLSAADDWNQEVTAGDTADSSNALTVSNVAAPAITDAAYDATAGTLTVTGTGLTKRDGQLDIDASLFTLTGESGATYTLVGSSDVEISSDTSFTLTLDATDKAAVNLMMNKAGTASTAGTTYNLAAAEDWARGADAAVNVADLTGNGITVSNIPAPTVTSATYNSKTGALVVTGSNFVKADGAVNDIDAGKLTLFGAMGTTRTLTSSSVEVTSATTFTVTLNSADKAALVSILDKAGTTSVSGTTYNLRAAEDWAAGADAAVNVADLSGNGITVTLNSAPTSADTTESVSYNSSYTFGTGDFAFNDSDTNDSLSHISILSLPDKGTLKLGGNEVSLNPDLDISASDLGAGQLTYTPDSGGTGSGYSSFTFSVSDGTADSGSQTVTLDVGAPPPAPTPTPKPDTETIDGVIVEKDTITNADGTTSSTVKIDPVTDSRQEDDDTNNGDKADIPLRQEADGNAALTVAIPIGIGITAEGNDQAKSAGNSLADLIRLIDETADDDAEAANKGEMLEGGETFLKALEDQNLWVNKLTLTASSETAPDAPIVVSGNAQTTDNGNDNSQAALVIDTRTLPTGTQLQLQDVEFAVIVGDGVVIRGGEGQNTVFAGSGSQDIVLGADDDQLYGGDGNDTVGSLGGDDLLFGENGNDTLFGGAGKDTMHGGRDIDNVTYDGTMADYDLVQTNGVITVTSKTDNTDSDTLVNVEQVSFTDGNYLAQYDTELKALATLYQNVLGRQADLAGFQWWAEQLDNGASFGDTILGFMQSGEYQGQLSQPFMELDSSAQLDALYQAVLGRAADDKGKNDWLTALDAGMDILEAAHGFAVSPELLGQLKLSTEWDFTL